VGIGVNWYVDRFVKIMMDYEQTKFTMATAGVTPLHTEQVLASGVQLAF